MTPAFALLAAWDGIDPDDLALILFFVVLGILKLIQRVLQRKAPTEEGRPPTEEPRDDAALNAVRTRAFLERGEWLSKAEAVEVLLDEVSAAVESRRTPPPGRGR